MCILVLLAIVVLQGLLVGVASGILVVNKGIEMSESELSPPLPTPQQESNERKRGVRDLVFINNSKSFFTFPFLDSAPQKYGNGTEVPRRRNSRLREKRGFFDKEKEKQRMEDEYDKSFR